MKFYKLSINDILIYSDKEYAEGRKRKLLFTYNTALYPYKKYSDDFLKYLRKKFPNFIVDEAYSFDAQLKQVEFNPSVWHILFLLMNIKIYKDRLKYPLKKMSKGQILEYTLRGGTLYDERC